MSQPENEFLGSQSASRLQWRSHLLISSSDKSSCGYIALLRRSGRGDGERIAGFSTATAVDSVFTCLRRPRCQAQQHCTAAFDAWRCIAAAI